MATAMLNIDVDAVKTWDESTLTGTALIKPRYVWELPEQHCLIDGFEILRYLHLTSLCRWALRFVSTCLQVIADWGAKPRRHKAL